MNSSSKLLQAHASSWKLIQAHASSNKLMPISCKLMHHGQVLTMAKFLQFSHGNMASCLLPIYCQFLIWHIYVCDKLYCQCTLSGSFFPSGMESIRKSSNLISANEMAINQISLPRIAQIHRHILCTLISMQIWYSYGWDKPKSNLISDLAMADESLSQVANVSSDIHMKA